MTYEYEADDAEDEKEVGMYTKYAKDMKLLL